MSQQRITLEFFGDDVPRGHALEQYLVDRGIPIERTEFSFGFYRLQYTFTFYADLADFASWATDASHSTNAVDVSMLESGIRQLGSGT